MRCFFNLILACLYIILVYSGANAGEKEDAIVLLEEFNLRITGSNTAILKTKIRIQINNEGGKKYSRGVFHETEYESYSDVQALVTDLNGNVQAELDEDDIHSSTMSNEISNDKIYWFELYGTQYPYIFEYVVEHELKSLMFWPDWTPGFDIPTGVARYRVVKEKPVPFMSQSVGIDILPVVSFTDGDSTWTWEIKDLPPIKKKYRSPPLEDTRPKILFRALEYEIEDHRVSTRSWNNIARWIRDMYRDQYTVNQETREVIQALAPDSLTDVEKINRITRYFQDNTRYVAVELGIGGWKPYSADWVMKNKMGDCKDLSTCLVTLLDIVGINAYPALIKTRDKGVVYPDFPSSQFNHVIVFVPLAQDTVWIEATSDHFAPGHLPYKDQGCDVLVILDDRGEIIRTPVSDREENFEKRNVTARLGPANAAHFDARYTLGGNSKIWFENLRLTQPKDEVKQSLSRHMGRYENTVTLKEYQFIPREAELDLSMTGEIANFLTQTRKRVFLNPNIFHRVVVDNDLKNESEERTVPVFYDYPFTLSDSVTIELPVTVKIESAPEAIEIENEFAYFKMDYVYAEKKLQFNRIYGIKSRQIPAELFPQYLQFLQMIEDIDSKKFVFLKY